MNAAADADDRTLRYLALNCTLKGEGKESSTQVLLDHVTGLLHERGWKGSTVRVVDRNVAFGVTEDEGDGDGWPEIHQELLNADLLVWGTPIWLGHPSSVTQMALERVDSLIADTDDRNQMRSVDKLAIAAVVGNEDGAHMVGSQVFQGLNDAGFTIPPGGMTYWVGEAMQGTDLKDLDGIPEKTASTAATMVANATHLAQLLRARPFPTLDD
jgi:multimeric flavodoxin WrbA